MTGRSECLAGSRGRSAGAQFENGEETVVANGVYVAVRDGHVLLRGGGGGARRWAHDATGVVNLRAVEAEGNGDLTAWSNVFSADGRTSVAEPRRLHLTVKRAIVAFVIKVEDSLRRASGWRERGADLDSGGETSEGLACGRALGEADDGVGEVGDAVVRVDGWEIAGETGGDRRRNGGEKEFLVLGGLNVGIRADGLGT